MATSPKAAPQKVVPIDEAGAAAAPKKSSKKLLIILVAAMLLLACAGGAAYYFLGKGNAAKDASGAPAHDPGKPPVFVTLEPFTVNLQGEQFGEQYLQVALTLQVADQGQVDQIKQYMPLLRSRLLLLLSGKRASELSTPEGKNKLAEEIVAQVKQPVAPAAPPQQVSAVFFTSFVIQ